MSLQVTECDHYVIPRSNRMSHHQYFCTGIVYCIEHVRTCILAYYDRRKKKRNNNVSETLFCFFHFFIPIYVRASGTSATWTSRRRHTVRRLQIDIYTYIYMCIICIYI